MNRYPLWKYLLIVLVLALGALYTVPNFFGESPAVQVSSAKATIKLGPDAVGRVQQALQAAGVRSENVFFEDLGNNGTVRVRFAVQGQDRDRAGAEQGSDGSELFGGV